MKSLDSLNQPIGWKGAIVWAIAAAGFFHAAYGISGWLFLGFFFCLVQLSFARTGRITFYLGLALGFACYAPQLAFFWRIFGAASIALWLVLAFWLAVFLSLGRMSRQKFGTFAAALLIPVLWTGLEYFRSELYYLKFSWLNAGYTFATSKTFLVTNLGMYGTGFVLMALAAIAALPRQWIAKLVVVSVLIVATVFRFPTTGPSEGPAKEIRMAGVQLEFPSEGEAFLALEKLVKTAPETELFVLSEYSFDGPVPKRIKEWCRKHQKYLIAGGKEPTGSNNFYNTAFVVGPTGNVIFKQVKSVPIQFFKDGLPAPEQKVWPSPWGPIGIVVCYDLSYRRVVDELVRQGANAIIVPTMDVADWGKRQHQLHARVAPTRARELGVPLFRLCSSGISQAVQADGIVSATASFPGQGETLLATITLASPKVPLDHWLAPACTAATAIIALLVLIPRRFLSSKRTPPLP